MRLNDRVLVCGGRDFDDYAHLASVLDVIMPVTLINGGCRGADTLAKRWGDLNSVATETYHAPWGRAAGPHRNAQMLDQGKPTLVVAFQGGMRKALRANAPVLKVYLP